jgi:hypothetical protein
MSIPLGCKKSPVFLDRGKGAVICATGGGARKRVGYSLLVTFSDSTGYALSGPTNERRYRSDVWGAILAMSKGTHDSRFAVHHPLRLMAAAFAHDLCMEHFSSALSGGSTNCADRGAQKMFSYFSLYALPLYVVSEIDNVATSARQNPELLPAKIHASGRERMRLHLPNLTKREICACVGGIPAGINPAARYAPNGYGFASAHRLVHFAVALSGRPFCAVLGYPSATKKGGAEIAPALDPLKPRANVLPVFHGYRARPDAEERMPLLQAGLSRFPVFSAAKSHLPNLTKREICVGNNSHAAAFCAPGNACFAGPRLALQLRQIGTTSNGRS